MFPADVAVPLPARRELAALGRLAAPIALGQLFVMATGFVDTVMAGRYSATDLAGVALAGTLLWPLFLFIQGITGALTPIVAQAFGAGRPQDAGPAIRQALWIVAFSSAAAIVLLGETRAVFAVFGADAAVVDIAARYLEALRWGLPGMLGYIALRQVADGLGQTRPGMLVAGAAMVINAVLNWVFIFGHFGAPELGGVGCGVATAITGWVELLLFVPFARSSWFRRTTWLGRFDWPQRHGCARLLRIGVPVGLTVLLEMGVFSLVGLLVAGFGVAALAGHSIAGNLNWLTFTLPASIGAAASIRIGHHVGATGLDAARRLARLVMLLTLGYAVVVSVALIAGRHVLVGIYSDDPAVLAVAANLLLVIAFYQLADDSQAVATGALRGYKDTFVPMLISLGGYWAVGLPLGAALAYGWAGLPAFGVYGFWFGLTAGLFIVALAAAVRLHGTSRHPERIGRLARH